MGQRAWRQSVTDEEWRTERTCLSACVLSHGERAMHLHEQNWSATGWQWRQSKEEEKGL